MSKTVSLYEDRELKTFNNVPAIKIGSDFWIPEDEVNTGFNQVISRSGLGDYDISGNSYSLKDRLSFASLPSYGNKVFDVNFRYGATTNCNKITITTGNSVVYTLSLSSQDVTVYQSGAWVNNTYKDITINSSGGSDASNSNLWYWLFANDVNSGSVLGAQLLNLYIDALASKYKIIASDTSTLSSLQDFVVKFLQKGGV